MWTRQSSATPHCRQFTLAMSTDLCEILHLTATSMLCKNVCSASRVWELSKSNVRSLKLYTQDSPKETENIRESASAFGLPLTYQRSSPGTLYVMLPCLRVQVGRQLPLLAIGPLRWGSSSGSYRPRDSQGSRCQAVPGSTACLLRYWPHSGKRA